MRHTILVLAVALLAGTTQARADLIAYNMTGTITSKVGLATGYHVGENISWTLALARNAPVTSSTSTSSSYVQPNSLFSNLPMIGYPISPAGTYTLTLSNSPDGNFYAAAGNMSNPAGRLVLFLGVNGSLPSLNLENLQLNNVPFLLGKGSGSYLSYYNTVYGGKLGFTASVNSISSPIAVVPEPGALTLSLLGAAGLAARGIRRRLRLRLVSFLAVARAG